MQLIAGLERELSAAGVALLLQVADDHEHAIAATRRWWAERRIDGVILEAEQADPRRGTISTVIVRRDPDYDPSGETGTGPVAIVAETDHQDEDAR